MTKFLSNLILFFHYQNFQISGDATKLVGIYPFRIVAPGWGFRFDLKGVNFKPKVFRHVKVSILVFTTTLNYSVFY